MCASHPLPKLWLKRADAEAPDVSRETTHQLMDVSILFAAYGAYLVGLISPGPDLVLVTALSLRDGKSAAIKASLGIALGVGLWVFASAAGIGRLIESAPDLWQGVRLLAGGVLIYMGARELSSAIRGKAAFPEETEQDSGSPLLLGLLTNLGNPKAAIVLVGLTSVLSDTVSSQNTLLLIVLGMPLMAAAWFISVSTILSHASVREYLQSRQRLLDLVVGMALAGVGVILIQTTPPL